MSARWWPRHILVGVFVAACVGLGIWQLARLHDRKAFNALLIERSHLGPVRLQDLPPPVGGEGDPDAYRAVTVEGEFDPEHEVILRARSLDGEPGNHVLTPLFIPDGRAVLVDRGWVPLGDDKPPVEEAAPAAQIVTVRGVLVPSQPKPRFFGPSDPKTGTLSTIGRLDVARIAKQLPYDLVPLALLELGQEPPQARYPVPSSLPPPSEGPHLGYAIQWFLFGVTGMVVYLAFYRRERLTRARRRLWKRLFGPRADRRGSRASRGGA